MDGSTAWSRCRARLNRLGLTSMTPAGWLALALAGGAALVAATGWWPS